MSELARLELVDLLNLVDESIKSDVDYSQEFFYFLRKNRDKIKSMVQTIVETNDQALKSYRDKLRLEKAIAPEHGANPFRLLDENKFNEIAVEYRKTLDESVAFMREKVEVEFYVWSKNAPENLPHKILDVLLTHGLIVETHQ